MSNLIVVESKNDKYFIESFIEKLNLSNIEVGQPICNINDFDCLGGISNLNAMLKALKPDSYSKIGIILDADEVGIEERIKLINESLKSICNDIELKEINHLNESKELDLEIACYITNIQGKGELETVMREVHSNDSTYADCLESWKECLSSKGIEIKQKELNKIWVSNYLKYDTCIGKDKKQKSKKCANELINNTNNKAEIENNLQSNDITIKKDIWNFEHSSLSNLKDFLQLFN